MRDELLYLRPNIQVEPLADQWYAWSHLIPPTTAARNLTERHLKIMESYVTAPQVHANAVKNPKMLGGPFIDYDGKRVGEIRELMDRTKKSRTRLLKLSAALEELDALLRTKAKGQSMQQLYPSVPDVLRGYVELVYDIHNNPSFRVIEPLLYKSDYYDRSAQSLMLSTTKCDDRPFVLSTPRLEGAGLLHLPWPFDDQRVDRLFRLKARPDTWRAICDEFCLPEKDLDLFRSFFTPIPPQSYEPYRGRGMRWRYFGHACILVETGNFSILTDPVLSYTYESSTSRYTYADLPDIIDYVLITHNHQDHILFETLLQLRHKIKEIIVPRNGNGALQDPSLKLTLENAGFNHVRELGEMETIEIENASLTGIPFLGEHSDLAISTKLGYLVKAENNSILFAADSCNIEPRLYDHLHRHVGDIDALFLGMECDGAPLSWLYGPLLLQRIERGMDESRRLSGSNYEQAIELVKCLNCREVYVYAMGQEPWLSYIMSLKYTPQSRPIVESNELIQECHRRGIEAERLYGEKEILLDTAF
jgi:L-ascorbate metabolism protein UlaG (beta-lactamase superfamily)